MAMDSALNAIILTAGKVSESPVAHSINTPDQLDAVSAILAAHLDARLMGAPSG